MGRVGHDRDRIGIQDTGQPGVGDLRVCDALYDGGVHSFDQWFGRFIQDLREHFSDDDQLITSEINDRDAIVESIREFLGKGK